MNGSFEVDMPVMNVTDGKTGAVFLVFVRGLSAVAVLIVGTSRNECRRDRRLMELAWKCGKWNTVQFSWVGKGSD